MGIVPVTALIRDLRAAGISVDYWDLLDRPADYWAQLSRDKRQRLLTASGVDADPDDVTGARVVRRRAVSPSIENVFISFDWTGEDSPRSSFANFLLYGPLSARKVHERDPKSVIGDDGDDLDPFELPQSLVQEAAVGKRDRKTIDVLDIAWGEGRYDIAVEGIFCEPKTSTHLQLIERYFVDEPFARVAILKAPDGSLIYDVEQPALTEHEKAALLEVNERLRDIVIAEDVRPEERPVMLARKTFSILKRHDAGIDRHAAYKIAYYCLRNYLGFGRIDVIMRDVAVEDASCNGPDIPLYVAHSRHRNVATAITFGELELNAFTVKLAQNGGKLLSVAQPLVDATLADGSRIQACLGREVTSHGSAFTIRKFREDPLTAVDLIRGGTHTVDTMALLWLAVEMKRSLIVMGATASGKTTTVNCLSQFIPPTQKIVTIEDTREITLQHENWLAAITRETFSGGGAKRVSMYDLLRAALRQRPDYIIVGEIRGEEGLTLFQAMSTGHTCLSTMHAGSVENAVHRLENPPIGVPRVMLNSLDMFLLQGAVDIGGKPVRRMLGLTEINGVDPATRNLRMNDIFRYDSATDKQEHLAASQSLENARRGFGWSRSRMDEELESRRRVLASLVAKNERHYKDVGMAVAKYYLARDSIPTPVAQATAQALPAAPVTAAAPAAPAPSSTSKPSNASKQFPRRKGHRQGERP